MRILILALTLAGSLVGATHDVNITSSTFNPFTVTVAPGDTVRWTNQDGIPHSVVSGGAESFSSPTLSNGQTFSRVYTQSGTHNYNCGVHPVMGGEVVVATATPTPTAAPTATISPTHTISPTFTPSPTITPTLSVTVTFSITPTVPPTLTPQPLSEAQAATGVIINSPRRGEDLCVVFDKPVFAAAMLLYNFTGQRVALAAEALRNPCIKTADIAPGLYVAKVVVGFQDGSTQELYRKAVIQP